MRNTSDDLAIYLRIMLHFSLLSNIVTNVTLSHRHDITSSSYFCRFYSLIVRGCCLGVWSTATGITHRATIYFIWIPIMEKIGVKVHHQWQVEGEQSYTSIMFGSYQLLMIYLLDGESMVLHHVSSVFVVEY
jgi:hypothetical protein